MSNFPAILDNINASLAGSQAQAGVHAQHHDDLASGLNAVQAAVTTTPAASKIPLSDGTGKLSMAWLLTDTMNGVPTLDADSLIPAARIGNGLCRMFESFGGKKYGDPGLTLASQTAAFAAYKAWALARGGGILGFGPYLYPNLPQLEFGYYQGAWGCGFPTILQIDSTVTGHGIISHVSTDGTLDWNGTGLWLQGFVLDLSQIAAGNVNASGVRTVTGTQDGIYVNSNPSSVPSGTAQTHGSPNRMGADKDSHTTIKDVYVWAAPRDGMRGDGWGDQVWANVKAYGCGRNGFRPPYDTVVADFTAGMNGESGMYINHGAVRVRGKSFYSGQITASQGHGVRVEGVSSGTVNIDCEVQDNRGSGFNVVDCGPGLVRIVGSADSNSTSSAGTYGALDIWNSDAGIADVSASDRMWDNSTPTQTRPLLLRSGSEQWKIRMTHKAVNGSVVGAPINAATDFSTCVNNDIEINGQNGVQNLGNVSGTVTPVPYDGRIIRMTLTGNITTFNVPASGQAHPGLEMELHFLQDATAGRTVSFAAGYKISWTPTTTANKLNILKVRYDGTNWVQVGAEVGL